MEQRPLKKEDYAWNQRRGCRGCMLLALLGLLLVRCPGVKLHDVFHAQLGPEGGWIPRVDRFGYPSSVLIDIDLYGGRDTAKPDALVDPVSGAEVRAYTVGTSPDSGDAPALVRDPLWWWSIRQNLEFEYLGKAGEAAWYVRWNGMHLGDFSWDLNVSGVQVVFSEEFAESCRKQGWEVQATVHVFTAQ